MGFILLILWTIFGSNIHAAGCLVTVIQRPQQ